MSDQVLPDSISSAGGELFSATQTLSNDSFAHGELNRWHNVKRILASRV
jgi:hypothetical protein